MHVQYTKYSSLVTIGVLLDEPTSDRCGMQNSAKDAPAEIARKSLNEIVLGKISEGVLKELLNFCDMQTPVRKVCFKMTRIKTLLL